MFEWEQIPETIGYDLQFSKDLEFSDGVTQIFTEDLVHIEKDMIEWDNTYYWRVRASDYENEGPGEWLDTLSFTTGVPLSNSSVNMIDEELHADGVTVFGAFFNYLFVSYICLLMFTLIFDIFVKIVKNRYKTILFASRRHQK